MLKITFGSGFLNGVQNMNSNSLSIMLAGTVYLRFSYALGSML